MEFFKASTQYGDWKGTAAADDRPSSLQELLADKGLIKPGEFLIAVTLHVFEHDYASPYVRAFVFQNGENFELNARVVFLVSPRDISPYHLLCARKLVLSQ